MCSVTWSVRPKIMFTQAEREMHHKQALSVRTTNANAIDGTCYYVQRLTLPGPSLRATTYDVLLKFVNSSKVHSHD